MDNRNMFVKIMCFLIMYISGAYTLIDVYEKGNYLQQNDLCKTECHQDSCVLNCENLNLTSIPTCDMISINCSLVTELRLGNNKMRNLPPAKFAHFTNLQVLDISNNPLEMCLNSSFLGLNQVSQLYMHGIIPQTAFLIFESGCFRPLTSIKSLNLGWSSSHLPSLFKSFCSLSEHIESISVNGMKTHKRVITLDDTLLKCFRNLSLKNFSFEKDGIARITFKALLNLHSVQHLSVKKNKITRISDYYALMDLHNLTYLDTSCQNSHVCEEKYPWSDWLINEPKMFQENKSIITSKNTSNRTNQTRINIFMFPNLQTLLIHNMPLSCDFIGDVCWLNNRLLNVDASFVTRLSIFGKLSCMGCLKFLNLRGIDTLTFDVEVFQDMPSLEILMLGSTGIPDGIFTKQDSQYIFVNNLQLRFLDMSNLGLNIIHAKLFSHLNKLETLILSHNQLVEVKEFMGYLPAIKHIDLSYNNLKEIPLSIIDNMEKAIGNETERKLLKFSNNPFICQCSSIYKLYRVLHSKITIHGAHSLNGSLRCTLTNNKNVPVIKAYEILKSDCRKLDMVSIIFIAVLYPLILCVICMLTCTFRYIWTVKYFWYNLGNYFRGTNIHNMDEQIHFDAFVAHAGKDEEWVRNILIRKLEHRERPYSLCVHYRSFLPGENITDNIISAINRSKTTILVVSKAFLKSGWCDFESRVAQVHHLGKTNHRIIAILFPGVFKYACRKASLKTLLDNVTCLEWPKNDEGYDVFWLRLCNALGKPLNTTTDDNYVLQPVTALN